MQRIVDLVSSLTSEQRRVVKLIIDEVRDLAVAFAKREWKAGSTDRSDAVTEFVDDIGRVSEVIANKPIIVDDLISKEVYVIELEPGVYYTIESASVTGFITTTEPLRASWVALDFAQKVTLPRLKKTHPEARIVTLKASYQVQEIVLQS